MRMCRIASTVVAAVVTMTFLSAPLARAQNRPSAPITTYELTLKDGSRSADVGLAVPLGTGDGFALPVVNFVYVF